MAKEPQAQLVRLSEVADTIGAPWASVERYAGKDVHTWWTGEAAVDFVTARKIAELWAADSAAAVEMTRQAELEHEAKIEAEREAYRRERDASRGQRVFHGVQVTVPGDPHIPDWASE